MARLNPYIAFQREAREAMEFYQSVFGGELDITRFGDFDMGAPENDHALVMHAQLETPDGFTIMGSDTPSIMAQPPRAGMSISIDGGPDDDAKFQGYWNALADGGTITMPLDTPPWGGLFGQLTDRFGVEWMVSIDTEE